MSEKTATSKAPAFLDSVELGELCRRNEVAMLGVFGSMARGEANADSDLDLLVRFSSAKSLLQLVRLERELTEKTGRKVDLVTEKSVSPYPRDAIYADLSIIYEA